MSTVHASDLPGAVSPLTERLLRLADVIKASKKSRASIYRAMDAGEFPRSVRIGSNSVAWVADEVSAWVEARIAARDSGDAK